MRTGSYKQRSERNVIRCETEAMRLLESNETLELKLIEMDELAQDAKEEAAISRTVRAHDSADHVFQLLMEMQERMRTTCSMCHKEFERSEQIYGVSCENCGKLMHICKKCKCGNWLCQSCA